MAWVGHIGSRTEGKSGQVDSGARLWGGVCILVIGSGDRGGTPVKVKAGRMAALIRGLLLRSGETDAGLG